MAKGDYESAITFLDKNRYVNHKHSRVLYRMENARLLLLSKRFNESFLQLEEADKELDGWNNLKERDIMGAIRYQTGYHSGSVFQTSSVSKPFNEILKSPRKVFYRPHPYERTLIHYYKAICLLQLNRFDDALIEARKLDELSHSYDDLAPVEPEAKRYYSDPWPQMISGILYELCFDPNNALIAYENAYRKWMEPGAASHFGITLPQQLKTDLMRLSYRLKFDDKLTEYERLFGYKYVKDTSLATCFVMIDNGLVPIKREDRSSYHIRNGMISKGYDQSKNSRTLSKPEFIPAHVATDPITEVASRKPDMLCHTAHTTLKTLNKRYNYEANWYLNQYLKNDSVVSRNNEHQSCDTRNWQSIPAMIQYVKIPSDTGNLTLYVRRQSGKTDTLKLYIRKGPNFCYIPH